VAPSPSIAILIPYFGQLPEWMDLFVESAKWNPTIQWHIHTDCAPAENRAENVLYFQTSFADYKARARTALSVDFDPANPYKLCDLRPALGELHKEELRDFEFFGWGDLDVIYGDLRRFYTDELLRKSRILSTHPEYLSGHFAVVRNLPKYRRLYERIPNYRAILEAEPYAGADEDLRSWIRPTVTPNTRLGRLYWRTVLRPRGYVFVERYSTVLSPRGWVDRTMRYPSRWHWSEGHLTTDLDGDREFMYLHFMRWRSRPWAAEPTRPGEGAWLEVERLVNITWQDARRDGFTIGREGFGPLLR
jgi:hypothetical protein